MNGGRADPCDLSWSRSRLSGTLAGWERSGSPDPFCAAVRAGIAAIPRGKVATYGQIAHLAGKPWGARQVSWILHSQSGKYRLPWQRVIGAAGRISCRPAGGFEEQRRLLRREGVVVDARGRVDLEFRWRAEGEFPVEKRDRPGRSLNVVVFYACGYLALRSRISPLKVFRVISWPPPLMEPKTVLSIFTW